MRDTPHITFTRLAVKGIAGHAGTILGRSDLLYNGYKILVTTGPRKGQEHHFLAAEFSSGGSEPVPLDSQ